MVKRILLLGLLFVLAASGCQSILPTQAPVDRPQVSPTPFQPLPTETAIPTPVQTATPIAIPVQLFVDPSVPADLGRSLSSSAVIPVASSPEMATLHFGIVSQKEAVSQWVYALVVPFPDLTDNISLQDLQSRWHGSPAGPMGSRPIRISSDTKEAFTEFWGEPGDGSVTVEPEDSLLDEAWNDRPSFAIVPFEKLEPRWKVVRVDGMSPLDKNLDVSQYPLVISFGWYGPAAGGKQNAILPATNRDPEKMTVLVMTGVTALVRATAYKMEVNGVTYPDRDIRDWLLNSDITHISNEVSFYPDCPYPNMADLSMYFCSSPKYIGLLEDVGADVIELTGNHNNDARFAYKVDVYPQTLDMYQERGWKYFGGGANLEEAKRPLTMEDHGNKLAFIGCNSFGPNLAWATDSSGGAAPCEDFEWMRAQVRKLREQGYLPVVTFQYAEDYSNYASPKQKEDFRSMVDAGAVIVQGSQAHTPKEMEFYQGSFIHYGLGNLFFDQMGLAPGARGVPATEEEFIDRHVIYDGRYISTELLTARLEDFAKPRPMSLAERQAFLKEIFSVNGW